MRAGAMKYRLQILKPIKETNEFGEDFTNYTYIKTIWAERVKYNAIRHTSLGEYFPDYTAHFNVRNNYNIKEDFRVKQLGGNLYRVTSIIPNIDKGMDTLICEKVND